MVVGGDMTTGRPQVLGDLLPQANLPSLAAPWTSWLGRGGRRRAPQTSPSCCGREGAPALGIRYLTKTSGCVVRCGEELSLRPLH